MRASSRAGLGQGWHKQSLRHSNARKTGTAGGKYIRQVLFTKGKTKEKQYYANPTNPQLVFIRLPKHKQSLTYEFKSAKDKNAFVKELRKQVPEVEVINTTDEQDEKTQKILSRGSL